MPIYEFQCRDCEHRFDDLVSVADSETTSPTRCPSCGEARAERLLSTFTMRSSGGGRTVQVDGTCLPGPATSGGGRRAGCCGGGCGGCG